MGSRRLAGWLMHVSTGSDRVCVHALDDVPVQLAHGLVLEQLRQGHVARAEADGNAQSDTDRAKRKEEEEINQRELEMRMDRRAARSRRKHRIATLHPIIQLTTLRQDLVPAC